jgi:hypothetical protein
MEDTVWRRNAGAVLAAFSLLGLSIVRERYALVFGDWREEPWHAYPLTSGGLVKYLYIKW